MVICLVCRKNLYICNTIISEFLIFKWFQRKTLSFNNEEITFFLWLYGIDIRLKTIKIIRKELHGPIFPTAARDLLYTPFRRHWWSTGWNQNWLNGFNWFLAVFYIIWFFSFKMCKKINNKPVLFIDFPRAYNVCNKGTNKCQLGS